MFDQRKQLSLLQSAMDSYYKLRQLFYYKVRHGILQIRGTQREYSSKPLKRRIVKRILVFKR